MGDFFCEGSKLLGQLRLYFFKGGRTFAPGRMDVQIGEDGRFPGVFASFLGVSVYFNELRLLWYGSNSGDS